jgi:DNA polymerase-3 subunit epsilon
MRFRKEPGYYGWIQGADFPLYTKVLTAIKLRKLNTEIVVVFS